MTEQRKCIVCQIRTLDPTQLRTCVPCVGRTRRSLWQIVDDYAELAGELIDHAGAGSPPGSTMGTTNSDGLADALVLLAHGMNGTVIGSKVGNREHARDQWLTDVSSVVGVLGFWEDDWRSERKLRAAQCEATVSSTVLFLSENLTWAAQHHDAFDAFTVDIRQLRTQIKVAIRDQGAVDRGKRLRCDKCHEPFVRYYRKATKCEHRGPHCDHTHPAPAAWPCRGSNTCGCEQGGRSDDWTCTGCDQVIDNATYWIRVTELYNESKRNGEGSAA